MGRIPHLTAPSLSVTQACPNCRAPLPPGAEDLYLEAGYRWVRLDAQLQRQGISWSSMPKSMRNEWVKVVERIKKAADLGLDNAQNDMVSLRLSIQPANPPRRRPAAPSSRRPVVPPPPHQPANPPTTTPSPGCPLQSGRRRPVSSSGSQPQAGIQIFQTRCGAGAWDEPKLAGCLLSRWKRM